MQPLRYPAEQALPNMILTVLDARTGRGQHGPRWLTEKQRALDLRNSDGCQAVQRAVCHITFGGLSLWFVGTECPRQVIGHSAVIYLFSERWFLIRTPFFGSMAAQDVRLERQASNWLGQPSVPAKGIQIT
ncbi:MAG: hypothetical protein MRY75_02630 [Marivita sp.]|uniref:hypothetical protein n=1 Tax=Marivita sp. TaxID=2003365 RepID=UPI0025C64D83|nr:hypothetical protein [Marivita sp.]MCI5109423.1 hypothetical protein [Marivita sp.]